MTESDSTRVVVSKLPGLDTGLAPSFSPPAPMARSTRVEAAAEAEVVEMLAEQTRFAGDPESRAVAVQLLNAGYTVREVSRRLRLRPHIVWAWAEEPAIKGAIERGRELRRRSLGQELEDAANEAIGTLVVLMQDEATTPKDRLKAAELILDRCGLVEVATKSSATQETAIKVDIDFDERLARIVAANRSSG
jgi:hypothetical protein